MHATRFDHILPLRAAISYTDQNVGIVTQAAKAAGLYDNAIVLFWGDHVRSYTVFEFS